MDREIKLPDPEYRKKTIQKGKNAFKIIIYSGNRINFQKLQHMPKRNNTCHLLRGY